MSAQLIQNLQNPRAYDHPVTDFSVLETHISWIILTGQYAYKIKKPVDFEFLNYSTLEKRRFYCEEEVRLNKILAPEIYLDVVTINGTLENPKLNAAGPILDYAVKMRQFSQETLFTKLLDNNEVTPLLIDKLAHLIAEFHQKTPVAPKDSVLGSPANVHAPVVQNFDQIFPLLSDSTDQKKLNYLRHWAEEQFVQHQELFQQRKIQGFIRDCHGDLHLGNIILYNQQPLLFDRIEFNEEFRWTDVIADIAFLAMDFEDHQKLSYARRLLNCYFSYTGDYLGLSLLAYYQSYRAMVRAKVALFRLTQSGLNEIEREDILQKYRNFITLAERYTQKTKPVLIVTYGLAGSGKSSIARIVVENLGAIQINSDVERKRLFGLPPNANTHADLNAGIYHPEATQKTYNHLADLARLITNAGYTVIVDATFLKRSQRDFFHVLANQLGIPFIIVNCQAPQAQLEKWIQERKMISQDPSEAGLEVLAMQEKNIEPLQSDEGSYTLTIDTIQIDEKKLVDQLQHMIQKT